MLHCDGKRRLSRALALIVAKAMRRRYDEPLVAYRCRGCGYWHVGSKL